MLLTFFLALLWGHAAILFLSVHRETDSDVPKFGDRGLPSNRAGCVEKRWHVFAIIQEDIEWQLRPKIFLFRD